MKNTLKLLVISPFYHTFVKGLTDALAQDFSEIDVLVHHNFLSEFAKFLPLSHFVHVQKFTKGNLVDNFRKPKNIKIHVISNLYFLPDGKNRSLGDILFYKYKNYIKDNGLNFDFIHAHFTWPSGYAAVKLAKEFNVPVIITLHENSEWLLNLYKSNNDAIYSTWASATSLIRVNKKDIPILRKFNANTWSIPNGYDSKRLPIINKIDARRLLGLPLDNKILFGLGNLIERKGFQYLIDAMSVVKKHADGVLCIIGGSGSLKNALIERIKLLNLQDCVKLIGFVPDQELKYWMNAADLFVLPSLSEGNPTVMFEALGVGLPFVGTRVGGVPEIITSDKYGILAEPGDPDDLAEKILAALKTKWDREKIRKYAERFGWKNIAKEVLKVYDEVLNSNCMLG